MQATRDDNAIMPQASHARILNTISLPEDSSEAFTSKSLKSWFHIGQPGSLLLSGTFKARGAHVHAIE